MIEKQIVCKECKHARKAFVEGKVACYLLSMAKHFGQYPNQTRCPHCGEPLGTPMDFDEFMNTVELQNDILYTGWASLAIKPNSTTQAMLTNGCYILDENNGCNYFEVNNDR